MSTTNRLHRFSKAALAAIASTVAAAPSWADGTEGLGIPSIAISEGTDLILAGVGLVNDQAGLLDVSIPAGASVVQVIAYWEGLAVTASEHGDTDHITIEGLPVEGLRIGGATHIIHNNYTSTYRADITSLGLLAAGENSLFIDGFDFGKLNDGLGLAIIIDDGSEDTTSIELRDGNDYAYEDFAAPLDDTDLQTFSFDSHTEDRDAELGIMLGHVSYFRSSVIEIYIDGVMSDELLDVIGDLDGAEWDTYTHALTVPAGATSVSIRPVSRDSVFGSKAGAGVASVTWVTASLELTTEDSNGDEGCSPWLWALNGHRWGGGHGNSMTKDIHSWTRFNSLMGLPRWRTGMRDHHDLMDALWFRGGRYWWRRALNRHTAAALANADSGMDYPFTVDEIISMYRDAVHADPGPETLKSVTYKFAIANYWNNCTLF